MSPPPGAELSGGHPTLTVGNASVSDGTVPTYSFEVALDRDFTNLAASAMKIPEGESGRTDWTVSPRLADGGYFWRARAVSHRDAAGPYSASSHFSLVNADVLIADSLQDGSSVGQVVGGKFISQGWQVVAKTDFIRYVVPTITSGFVEWENTGLRTPNPAPDNFMLFGMWDGSPEAGPYRTNAFRVHIQKLDESAPSPFLRLRWIANGEEHDTGTDFALWEPGRVYRWRIEWGSDTARNTVRVFLDGVPIILEPYSREYAPKQHRIELGIQERRESIVGAVYSNVRIGFE